MDFSAPITKVITVVVITVMLPVAMVSTNSMDMTNWSATEIAIGGLFGIIIILVFLNMIMKE